MRKEDVYNMKKMRLPLLIALGVAIIGVVLGSFFDLQISTAIASPTNAFALTVSAICPTIGFATVAAMGGGFIALILKGKYHIALKIVFGVLAAACFGVSIFYPGGEYFGINGFYGAAPEWVGYLIVIIPEAAAAYGGYIIFKDCKNEKMYIIFMAIIAMLLIGLLAIIPTIKDNMHRPRYRLISTTDAVAFHNWWQPCLKYNELKDSYPHDNFKSFPSGHTAETTIVLVGITFLPMADEKYEKYQLPIFLGGCGLVLLIAIARILAAAHYLSDVSMGATIIIGLLVITNEVITHIKPLQLKKEVEEEIKVEE